MPVIIGAMEFFFMAGSMGSVVGEKVARAAERALAERKPLILVSTSGGARMQEGILSLMQMGKISAALGRLAEGKIPYISVMTDPTTGGVTASYAMLGDLNVAEPNALIGFAGPRVIEQTIRQTLPEGFQRSEFLLEHGMLDFIVDRSEMKATLARCLRMLHGAQARRCPSLTPALWPALSRLESLDLRGMKLGLAAIDEVCERLGRPERAVESILVAGTNGKGSTAATLASIAEAAGVPTGLYTSPHLESVTERIRIGRDDIAPGELDAMLARGLRRRGSRARGARDVLRGHDRGGVSDVRAARGWGSSVLEVGLGGRLDATNVAPASVSVVTPIGLDHTEDLGPTAEAIAGEKAGIFRTGRPALVASREPEAPACVSRRWPGVPARACTRWPPRRGSSPKGTRSRGRASA